LAHPRSASALAALIPARLGVTPPLGKFRLSDAEHAQWAESFNGGRCDDDCRFRNRPFSGALVDVTSAFPLVAHLVDWWAVSIASTLRHRDVTTAVRRACERAASDPTSALDPALWRRLGVTLVEVVPDGEPFPIELDDHARPDGRTEVVPVFSPERPLFKPWPDVVAAAAEGGRAPLIVRATRLVPGPPEPGLRKRLPFLPGTVLSSDRDPAVALVRRRWQAKAEGDKRLARVLHAQVSALVSGNPSRFDPIRRKVGGRWEPWEGPGPWAFLPIACTVQSGARLLLAVLDRLVRDLGGVVAYRDTDSSVIPSSPDGGTITLPDGSTVRELSWAAVDSVLAPFSRLSPEPAWEVWKVERGTPDDPLQVVVFGPKRHAQFVALDDDLPRMDEWTSAGLGGMWAAPPRMTRWTKAAVEREIAYAVARQTDPEAVRSPAPWERAGNAPFPTMRRLMVTSPEVLRSLPGALGARPGSRYLVGVTDTTRGRTGEAVALDPGGSLDGWQRLRWVVRGTGAPIAVSTTPSAKALRFETLDFRATGYAAPPKGAPITEVHIDPTRIRHRGRVSGVIDASDDGLPGDLAARRPVYDEPDLLATVHAHARTLGPAAFARRTDLPLSVAKRAAGGRPISKRNVLRAVRALAADPEQGPSCGCGCGQPVDRRLGAIYVNDTHRARAKKRRQRATPTTSDQERRSA
ncbi:MAG TPA: hypothetical protein VNE21_05670, partial [Mycobacteriales bacterium]|nr:hypothetical protein [Mycobacteriales bacterium]